MSFAKSKTTTPYTALYRRWRPQLFSQVVGQEHVTRTLQNALSAARIAHAYLFCGLRGTGKTTMAKLLAKAVNCLEGVAAEPCNVCRSCVEITGGRSLDVIEIDAASNRGIDEIRDLREKIRYAAASSRYKVYIIDEVHMLTNEAFNALLKTLEEPPAGVIFILATTEMHKLPLTVVSRCQRFEFHLLEAAPLAAHLARISREMNFSIDEETCMLLARLAEGSARDALGLLEQCRAFGGEKVDYAAALEILGLASPEMIYRLLSAVAAENIGDGLTIINEVVYRGRDLHRFLRELILYLRKLLMLQAGEKGEKFLEDVPGLRPYLLRHRQTFDHRVILEMLEILQQLTFQLKGASQPQFLLELAFLRLVRAYRFREYLSPGDLFRRLEDLEGKLQSAGLTLAGPAEPPLPAAEEKGSPRDCRKSAAAAADEKGEPSGGVQDDRPPWEGSGEQPEDQQQENEVPVLSFKGLMDKKNNPAQLFAAPREAAAAARPRQPSLPEEPPFPEPPPLDDSEYCAPAPAKGLPVMPPDKRLAPFSREDKGEEKRRGTPAQIEADPFVRQVMEIFQGRLIY